MVDFYDFKKLVDIYLAFNSVNSLNELLEEICKQTTQYIGAERSSIYLYDKNRNILYTKVAEGLDEKIIKLKIGQGIAGAVAETRKSLIVNNAYKHKSFDSSFDKKLGYKTKRILSMPLINLQNELIGVIQILNKPKAFDDLDIKKLNNLNTISAVALNEVKLFEDLKHIKELNDEIINSLDSPILLFNSHHEVMLYNDSFRNIFLNDSEELLLEKKLPEKIDSLFNINSILKSCAKKKEIKIFEHKTDFKGKTYFFNICAKKINSQSDMTLFILYDITELHDLKQSKFLSIIGKFTASIIHDLKSPISLISGYAELMKNLSKEDNLKKYCDIIISETRRIADMTQEILDFSRNSYSLSFINLNISGFFDAIKYQLVQNAESNSKKVEIKIIDDFRVSLDMNKMQRVIYNLVDNSLSVIKKNETVTIIARLNSSGKPEIIISDNGPGIPLKIMDSIFEPFVSGKTKGTGLGLSIAKKITEEHNGSLTFRSEPSKGAEFIITLPLVQ